MKNDLEIGGVEVLDPRGDLKLIVGETKVVFKVCSRALAPSSPVWDILLCGPFAEGQSQQTKKAWEIPLPGDDPDGLRILLSVVHYKHDALPDVVSYDLFLQLVVLADKYDMVPSLRPFWVRWHQWRTTSESIFETPWRLIRHLWISYVLGDGRSFHCAIIMLMFRAAADEEGDLYLEDTEEDDSYDLDTDEFLTLLDILDKVKVARLAVLKKIHTGVKDAMGALICGSATSLKCAAPDKKSAVCDCAMLGALHRSMVARHAEYWYFSSPERMQHRSAFNHLSVSELSTLLEKILADASTGVRDHANCNPWVHTELFMFDTLPEVHSLVFDHAQHLQKQAKKSGLDPELSLD